MKRLTSVVAAATFALLAFSATGAPRGLWQLRGVLPRLLLAFNPNDGQAPQAPTDAAPDIPLGGPGALGPMDVATQRAHLSASDVVLPGTWSSFALPRRFTSNAREEINQALPGDPNPINVPKAPGRPFGPANWTHSLYAYAQYSALAGMSQVRDGEGGLFTFSRGTGQWWTPALGYKTNTRFDGVRLVKPGQAILYFERSFNIGVPANQSTLALLTRIDAVERTEGGTLRTRLTLDYTPPPSTECAGLTTTTNPYVTKVLNAEGFALTFHYVTVASTCVLSSVGLVQPGGGAELKMVSYDYSSATDPIQLRLVGVHYYDSAGADAGTSSYGYVPSGLNLWDLVDTENGVEQGRQTLTNPDAGTYDGTTQSIAFGLNGATDMSYAVSLGLGGDPAFTHNLGVNNPGTASYLTGQEDSVPLGDGTSSTVSLRHQFEVYPSQGYVTRASRSICASGCNTNGLVTPGAEEWSWGTASSGEKVPLAYRDPRGGLTVYSWDAGAASTATLFTAQGLQAPVELQSITYGALDQTGASGLLKKSFSYLYSTTPIAVDGGTAPSLDRFLSQTTEPSTLSGIATTTVLRSTTTNNKVRGIVRACAYRPCRSPIPGDADHLFRPRRSPGA